MKSLESEEDRMNEGSSSFVVEFVDVTTLWELFFRVQVTKRGSKRFSTIRKPLH